MRKQQAFHRARPRVGDSVAARSRGSSPTLRAFGRQEEHGAWIPQLLMLLLPALILLAIFFFFLLPRFRDPLGGGFLSNYIKSPAKRYTRRTRCASPSRTWRTCNRPKANCKEIVDFLKEPQKFQRLGGAGAQRAAAHRPAAPAKTLLARAVAARPALPFFSISGSEFIQMFCGVGAAASATCSRPPGKCALPARRHRRDAQRGRQVTIQEMFERGLVGAPRAAMTADFRIDDATVLAITRKPCAELLSITTSTGAVKATANHLFPVLRPHGMEWVRADELAEGDYVAAPRRIRRLSNRPCSSIPTGGYDPVLPTDAPGRLQTRLRDFKGPPCLRGIARCCGCPSGMSVRLILGSVPERLTEELVYLCGCSPRTGLGLSA